MDIETLRTIFTGDLKLLDAALLEADRKLDEFAKKPRPGINLGGGMPGGVDDPAKIAAAAAARVEAVEKESAARLIAQQAMWNAQRAEAQRRADAARIAQETATAERIRAIQQGALRSAYNPWSEASSGSRGASQTIWTPLIGESQQFKAAQGAASREFAVIDANIAKARANTELFNREMAKSQNLIDGSALASARWNQQLDRAMTRHRSPDPISGWDRLENMQRQGRQDVAAGMRMSMLVTAPVVIGAGFAVKEAAEYGDKIKHVEAMTNLGHEATQRFSREILGLYSDPLMRKGPSEMADGLYYVATRGFQGADAMTMLKAGALGASAGMGEIKDVVNTTTAILNAYNMKASQATYVTDLMAATARAGGGATEEMAKAFPKVIPLAAAMGIRIMDVAAAMATMTREGISANTSAVSLNRFMLGIEKPSAAAVKALDSIKFSVQQVRASVQDAGLHDTLEKLVEKSGGRTANGQLVGLDVLTKIAGTAAGARALLATVGNQSETYRKVTLDLMEVTGSGMRAAETAMDTFAAKWDHLKAVAEVAAISIGERALPMLSHLADSLGRDIPAALKVAENEWDALPTVVQRAIQAMLGIAVIAGPFMMAQGAVRLLVSTLTLLRPLLAFTGIAGLFAEGGALAGIVAAGPMITAVAVALAAVGAVVGYNSFGQLKDQQIEADKAAQHLSDTLANMQKYAGPEHGKILAGIADEIKVEREVECRGVIGWSR